jgi:hypothetical protein
VEVALIVVIIHATTEKLVVLVAIVPVLVNMIVEFVEMGLAVVTLWTVIRVIVKILFVE